MQLHVCIAARVQLHVLHQRLRILFLVHVRAEAAKADTHVRGAASGGQARKRSSKLQQDDMEGVIEMRGGWKRREGKERKGESELGTHVCGWMAANVDTVCLLLQGQAGKQAPRWMTQHVHAKGGKCEGVGET